MAKKYWWQEDEEQKVSQSGDQTKAQTGSKYWWDDGTLAATISKNVAGRVNQFLTQHDAYISDYQKRYAGRKGGYEDAYVSDSAEWLEKVKTQKSSFDSDYDSILSYIDQYKDYLDEEWVLDVKTNLLRAKSDQNRILNTSANDKMYWSQWATEDAYQKDVAAQKNYEVAQKDYDAKRTADLDALAKEIETLTRDAEEFFNVRKQYAYVVRDPDMFTQGERDSITAKYNTLLNRYGSVEDIDSSLNEKKVFLNQARRIQEGIALSGVANNEDFTANSGYVSTEYDNAFGKLGSRYGLGYKDIVYEYINGAENGMRDKIIRTGTGWHKDGTGVHEMFDAYDQMTEDEIAIYNYYYAKEGKEAAEKYLDNIQESLNAREASKRFSQMEGKTFQELAFGVTAGIDQFASGIKNVLNTNDEYLTPSVTQIQSGMVREDLADAGPNLPAWMGGASLGQVGYDTVTTTANMAPSILASVAVGVVNPAAGQWVGSSLMGASAAGSAYQEALNNGYSKSQARGYSTLVGASEVVLEKVLGGISAFGGNALGKYFTANISNADTALKMIAKRLGASALSEFSEEYLQEVLTPVFSNMMLGTDEDVKLFSAEALYSGILGALTAGVLEGPTTIAGEVGTYNTGKKLQAKNISSQRLAELGKTFSADTVAYQLADKVNENTGAYTMGRLFNEIGATVSKQNVTEITNALVAKGMDETTAKKNAEALGYVMEGGQLSEQQIAVLEANDVLADTAKAVLMDADATWNQRTQGYNDIREALAAKAPKVEQGTDVAQPTKAAESQQEGAVAVTETSMGNVSANGQQMVSKLTDKESLQNTEESPATEEPKEKAVTLEGASKKYGAQAKAMVHTYQQGQDVAMYDAAYQLAYNMGKAGVSVDYVKKSQAVSYLTDIQKELAYEAGQAASNTKAQALDAKNKAAANGKTGRRKGVVKGEGVTIADIKKTFNDTQGKAYKYLSTVAEATGIDIVLYRSVAGPDGKFRGAQGRYNRSKPGTIYIDLNAGLTDIKSADDLGKYAMLRTFAHEFTHFVENWNPIQYNELRKVVFDTLTERGENVDALIKEKQARNPGMNYDMASREVVAEAMTDILPDASFVQTLAKNHKTIFQKLLDQLKDFVANLREYFNAIGRNPSKEANALKVQMGKTVKYLDSIVELFDKAAVEAVENYQQSAATDEAALDSTRNDDVQYQGRKRADNDPYPTADVHWGIEAGIVTEAEARAVWKAIADSQKRKIVYPKTVSGEIFVANRNFLMVVYPDYRYPRINTIYKFAEQHELSVMVAGEEIINAKGIQSEERKALDFIEIVYGEGYVTRHTIGDYRANARKNGRGEGKNSGTTDSGDSEQYQQRTNTLTDRDILAIAEKRGITEMLSSGQVSALQIFNKKNAEIGELLKQKANLEKMLKDLQGAAKPNKSEIVKTRNRIKVIASQIDSESAQLRQYEAFDTVKGILAKVKPVVEQRLIEERKKELAKYGTIPQGEKAVRESNLPQSTDGKNKVSRTARTVKEVGVTPDDFAELIDKEVYLENGLSYLPVSNNEATQKAIDYITEEGWEAAKGNWSAQVRSGKVSAELSAMGALLLNNAARAGDKQTWLDILHDYQMMSTNAGQAVQALRILKTLTPDDRLYMAHKSINRMVKDLRLKREIQVDTELEAAYLAAETDEARDDIMAQIQQDVADQIPATFKDKWTSLRYLNMLGNLRTQVRNLAGNAVMGVTVEAKNLVAAGLETMATLCTGGKYQKNKALFASKDLMKAAFADYAIVKSIVSKGGKYNDQLVGSSDFAQGVMEKRKIFKSKVLEKYRKATNWAMENGDVPFSKYAYARALAGYLKQHGFDGSDLSKAGTKLMEDARQYAVQEAQEATFHDLNMLSKWVTKVGRRKDTPAIVRGIADGVAPFRQTPANIAVRAEEYSLLGLVNSLYYTVQAARETSDITPAQAINSWAKTITGSALFFVGWALAASGDLIGGPDDDEDRDRFAQMYGQQNYALKVGDTYITIDWASPAAIPMLMGAQFYRLKEENGFQFKDITGAFSSLADPLIEMSMLQGINDTLEKVKYSDNNLIQIAINSSLGYLTQGLTNSLVGQLERSFEDSRMTTYVDENSQIPNWLQQLLGKASAKIPGWDYNQIPYINAWGEEQENPDLTVNAIYNMLSPSYISKDTKDAVYEELMRLDDAQSDENVIPNTPEKKYEGRYLSADEYVALAKSQGQMQRKLVEDIIASKGYRSMSDTDKAKTVKFAYKYAKEYAQIRVLGRKSFSAKWLNEIKGDPVPVIIQHVLEQ